MSILIPTYGRARKLGRCLECLARQTFPADRFEVLVGADGRAPEEQGEATAQRVVEQSAGRMQVALYEFEHAGPACTRNRLARHARGRYLLLLNDDVLPERDLVEVHVREQARFAGRAGMVLGAAPWVVPDRGEDSLFDRLIRETSMIFFYDRMEQMLADGRAGRDHDWGFRHAWTLNLSLPRAAFEAVGGFDERLRYACYEDLEFAYRISRSSDQPVPLRFAPEAVVHHDHRIRPEDYLARERMMGRAAWAFAEASPACAGEVFGRDIRSDEEIAYSRSFIAREAAAVERLRETFAGWAKLPGDAITGPSAGGAGAILRGLYEHHLLLKRWTWRSGLLDAAAG